MKQESRKDLGTDFSLHSNVVRMVWRVSLPLLFCFLPAGRSQIVSEGATHELLLDGTSTGGTLGMIPLVTMNPPSVTITNVVGDNGFVVAQRLATTLEETVTSQFLHLVSASSNSLVLPGFGSSGRYALSGSETGFNIPALPTSLSANLIPTSQDVLLAWENAEEDYDFVVVLWDYRTASSIHDGSTSILLPGMEWGDRFLTHPNASNFRIVAYRDGLPSNAASVFMRGSQQEDFTNLPFTLSVAPGWKPWQVQGLGGMIQFAQGDRHLLERPEIRSEADDAAYYQRISGSGSQFSGGILRRFLGLDPGATYKVAARLNTLGQETSTNWTYSVHAAHSAPDNSSLTPQQLAGTASLPDSSQGAAAGRIGSFGESDTTEGFWIECATDGACPDREIGNIQLPTGVTSLTVWVRLTGTNTIVNGVGIDWVSIEKL